MEKINRNETDWATKLVKKVPFETQSESRQLHDEEDDDSWMKDDESSFLDETEETERALPFGLGLNHSWPRVTSASRHNLSSYSQKPRKLLRQISQESLDESTSLLVGHVVMLPSQLSDHVTDSSTHLDLHSEGYAEFEGNYINKKENIGRHENVIVDEENHEQMEMRKENLCHAEAEVNYEESQIESEGSVHVHVKSTLVMSKREEHTLNNTPDLVGGNVASELTAHTMLSDERNNINNTESDSKKENGQGISMGHGNIENQVSEMLSGMIINDGDVVVDFGEVDRIANVMSGTGANMMVQQKHNISSKDSGKDLVGNEVSNRIGDVMVQDDIAIGSEVNGRELGAITACANPVSEMVSEEIDYTIPKSNNNVVTNMVENIMLTDAFANKKENCVENVVSDVISDTVIQNESVSLDSSESRKSQEFDTVSDIIANRMCNEEYTTSTGKEDDQSNRVFHKKCFPSNSSQKRPPLLRHISQESIEESTNLLLDHVVMIDLEQPSMGEVRIGDKPGKCPFLVDIAENPLINEALVALPDGETNVEDEEQFLYKGEVHSSDCDDDDIDDGRRPEDTELGSNSACGMDRTPSIVNAEAASTLQNIELIRVDIDNTIRSLQSLKEEFPDRDVQLRGDIIHTLQNLKTELPDMKNDFPSHALQTVQDLLDMFPEDEPPKCNASEQNEQDSDVLDSCDTTDDTALFNQLPDEVILHVFHYLEHFELLMSVALVCKKWRHLALDPTLWQHLNLSYSSPFTNIDISALLQRCPLVQSISLRGLDNVFRKDIEALSMNCPRLHTLDLGFVTHFDINAFDVLICGCQMLTSLTLEGCDQVVDSLISKLILLPRLKMLGLSHCTKLTDEAICEIARFCPHLEVLDIDGIPWVTDSAVISLVNERMSTLRCLKLDGQELTDTSIRHILQCLELEELSISFCEQLTDSTLGRIQEWKNPRRLRLQKGKEFSETGLQNLFNLPTLSQLTQLNLSECTEIRDPVVISIANRCPLLTHLAIEWCWFVTDTSLIQIIDNCKHLQHLDLIGLYLIVGHWLVDIPTKLPKLQMLDLRQCNAISDSLLVPLVFKKHDLIIMNYYGEEVKHDNIPSTLAV